MKKIHGGLCPLERGKTEKMAETIAEGIRMKGHAADIVKISTIKTEKDMEGYDGYVFGCPTYHRDMTRRNENIFCFWPRI